MRTVMRRIMRRVMPGLVLSVILRAALAGLFCTVLLVPGHAAEPPEKHAFFGKLHGHSETARGGGLERAENESAENESAEKKSAEKNSVEREGKRPLDFFALTDSARDLGRVAGLPEVARVNWKRMLDTAERLNVPGKRTTFAGFEYASSRPCGEERRHVIFQSDDVEPMPLSSLDSQNPQRLWHWMDTLRARGGEALSIPHMHQGTSGCGFAHESFKDATTGREYLELMVRNEPLLGQSAPLKSGSSQGGALRQALAVGLRSAQAGPGSGYTFGLTGAGDSHTDAQAMLTGVWAEENSRQSIYAALRRRETFATSDTRIALRMHAGFRFPKNLFSHENRSLLLRKRGVPMGSELRRGRGALMLAVQVHQSDLSPSQADQQGQMRLQVVKVWIENGKSEERVFDIAGGETPGLDTASPLCVAWRTGEAFASSVARVWSDPSFDPAQPASYYVRVLEDASCGATPDNQTPGQAFTSPVWYLPNR